MQKSHRRSTKVCTRCRQRKTKCDFKFPQCTPCKRANTSCLGFDPATRQAVPRSIIDTAESLVKSLEARVAQLEVQLGAVQSTPQNLSYSMASKIAQATTGFGVPTFGSFLESKVSPALFFRPSCPPLSFSPIIGERGIEILDQSKPLPLEKPRNRQKKGYASNPIKLNGVPYSALEQMVRNYADTHLPQYPIIPASLLDSIVERLHGSTGVENSIADHGNSTSSEISNFEYFVMFIALAISASTLTWKAEDQARAASESFYKSAVKYLQMLDGNSEMKALQISLLLAHYAHMCPERVDNWTCIANAVRIVLSLGLYRECPESLNSEQAKERSRLFWVTYGMERSLCTNLRLPLSFPEELISAKLEDPSPEDYNLVSASDYLKRKSSANHIYRYRALETEVHRVLYLEEELHKFPGGSLEGWIKDINARMEIWYKEAQSYRPYNMLEFKRVQFYHLRVRIHRPTPRKRTTTPKDWCLVLKSSRKLIDDYLGQDRRRRLFYPWHGAHILFEIASTALDASWSCRNYQPLKAEAMQMLQKWIPQCLQILDTIGKRWDEATKCPNRLRPLVQKVCSAFSSTEDSGVFENAITEEIKGLLFSERSPTWNLAGIDMNDPNSDSGPLFLDQMSEGMEFLQWAPDWGIVPQDMTFDNELAENFDIDIGDGAMFH